MSYSPHSLCTVTDFNLFKHKRNWLFLFFYPFHYIKSTQCFCGHSCARVRSLPHKMMGVVVVQVIRCVRGLEWRLMKDWPRLHISVGSVEWIQFYWSRSSLILSVSVTDRKSPKLWSVSLPESSDALSGVRMLGAVCSTSTWISSVSSVFFLCEVFFWLSPWDNRALFLSLLFLLSPGSLRSSRSRVEERTVRRWHMVSFSSVIWRIIDSHGNCIH